MHKLNIESMLNIEFRARYLLLILRKQNNENWKEIKQIPTIKIESLVINWNKLIKIKRDFKLIYIITLKLFI